MAGGSFADEYYFHFGYDFTGGCKYIRNDAGCSLRCLCKSEGLGMQVGDALGTALGTFAGQTPVQKIFHELKPVFAQHLR